MIIDSKFHIIQPLWNFIIDVRRLYANNCLLLCNLTNGLIIILLILVIIVSILILSIWLIMISCIKGQLRCKVYRILNQNPSSLRILHLMVIWKSRFPKQRGLGMVRRFIIPRIILEYKLSNMSIQMMSIFRVLHVYLSWRHHYMRGWRIMWL